MRYPYGQWPGYQPTFRLFGRSLTLGGKLETELDYRKDLELRKEAEDDRLRLDQELQLEFFYRLASRVSLWRRLTPLES
ncbi:hypothetical protein C2W62_18445 [Candidatus Entotheonella serta]|nr:hypothetical protein C2W62_18445 [Candidatus Entotheonella serta]